MLLKYLIGMTVPAVRFGTLSPKVINCGGRVDKRSGIEQISAA
jgi:hypothetical protein